MSRSGLPTGSFVQIAKQELQILVEELQRLGFRTIGPTVADGAIVYDEVDSVEQFPIGYVDEQDGGIYRLKKTGDAWFDWVVGPHSLKNYLFPPRETLVELHRANGSWQVQAHDEPKQPLAVIGVRSCDLHALAIQDRVFIGDQYVDPGYQSRRDGLFAVAINCRRAAATCFCHSMNTGPAVRSNFDLALTEREHQFVVQVGSQRGGEVLAKVRWSPCSANETEQAKSIPEQLRRDMEKRHLTDKEDDHQASPHPRHLDTTNIRDLLLDNLEHARWEDVAERCISCANCTMVCPTCFCSSVEEVTDLTGDHVRRERTWGSCFTSEHSYMTSGTVRKSTASRYRQWLTHKLASWIDQFDTSGCVGCGRCITWCPVGIDLTEEVAAIRGEP